MSSFYQCVFLCIWYCLLPWAASNLAWVAKLWTVDSACIGVTNRDYKWIQQATFTPGCKFLLDRDSLKVFHWILFRSNFKSLLCRNSIGFRNGGQHLCVGRMIIFMRGCKILFPCCFKKQKRSRPHQRQAWVVLTWGWSKSNMDLGRMQISGTSESDLLLKRVWLGF